MRGTTFNRYQLPFLPLRATLPLTFLHEHAVYSPDLSAKCNLCTLHCCYFAYIGVKPCNSEAKSLGFIIDAQAM